METVATLTNILALIPARGGSKSIPRKNIRPLGGHPLLAYSIAAGLQARTVTRVIVSTDDEEIATIARRYGAETPFIRPNELAQDDTTDLPVFQHALHWLAENEAYHPMFVVQLRPTSPFRPPDCVDNAVKTLLDNPQADSIRGIVPSVQNPYKMWRISENRGMTPLLDSELPEPYNMPRQKLPPTFWQTGHIDAIRANVILMQNSISGHTIYPLRIDPNYTIDLDTELDWEWAEWRLRDSKLEIIRPQGVVPRYTKDTSTQSIRGRQRRRSLPKKIGLVVFDFDGVMTDNRVYVNQDGVEMVAAHRGDGTGIELLKKAGVEAMILSTEVNKVVATRARKLKIPVIHGVGDKGEVLQNLLQERGINPQKVIYLGNDVNDLPCFPIVGCAIVVADAHPQVLTEADIVLTRKGGDGAVRELCDLILLRKPHDP